MGIARDLIVREDQSIEAVPGESNFPETNSGENGRHNVRSNMRRREAAPHIQEPPVAEPSAERAPIPRDVLEIISNVYGDLLKAGRWTAAARLLRGFPELFGAVYVYQRLREVMASQSNSPRPTRKAALQQAEVVLREAKRSDASVWRARRALGITRGRSSSTPLATSTTPAANRQMPRQPREQPAAGTLQRDVPVPPALPEPHLREEWIPPEEDARRLVEQVTAVRPQQARFGAALIAAYGGACTVTGTTVAVTLEAAHIVPHRGAATDIVQNGLLLRTDLHALFDADLLGVDPDDLGVRVHRDLLGTEYAMLEMRPLRLPRDVAAHPSKPALRWRYIRFLERCRRAEMAALGLPAD
ncbi:HNH endonuclease [Azospirillum palustre]|uniref:HNH endonuclease n=1 Tax=Azospirillum palustre TaxID=2044885 RepID=UPI00137B01F9|nr:HNH endonuclease signature motif containing protein [Azospirillum palustre]